MLFVIDLFLILLNTSSEICSISNESKYLAVFMLLYSLLCLSPRFMTYAPYTPLNLGS